MIRVVKPSTPPVVLGPTGKGTTARQNHCNEYDAAPDEYRSGTRTFTFDDSIYAADEVKDALRRAQHSKCAFCESLFTHIEYGDIEHFRPKGAYKQKTGDAKKYPGYYWLAYEWSNLFYSCQLCNQRFKENLFPLRNGRRRARSHNYNLANEEPLLIDPATQDPSLFIGFSEEYAFAVNGCREGVTTIDVLGLNREELAEYRRKRLQDLRILRELCNTLREIVASNPTPERSAQLQEYETELQSRLADTAEYSAMARAFLAP
jgi:uncharacterized protein (TIGR02646 family)